MLSCQYNMDLIAALDIHYRLNFSSTEFPLASYIHVTSSGNLLPSTRRKFLARFNRIFEPQNLLILTGYCLKIGSTTNLLLFQISPDIVKLLDH